MISNNKKKRNPRVAVGAIFVYVLLCLSCHEQYVTCFKIEQVNRRCITSLIIPMLTYNFLGPSREISRANAVPFIREEDRRQKELCVVNLLRLQFWAISLSDGLKGSEINDEERRKTLYLEARLGSKVIVSPTKNVNGGATVKVFMLKSLNIKDCLKDLTYYVNDAYSKKQMIQKKDDLIESLASIVEFDGLETTQDSSPRSSLTLSMYTPVKVIYVQRMLSERIVPLIDDIVHLFGEDTMRQSEQ